MSVFYLILNKFCLNYKEHSVEAL